MFRSPARLLLAAFILSLTLALPAQADSGAVTAKPANPHSDNSRTRSWFLYSLNPGESVSDAVTVINASIEPKKIAVYATDSLVASGGSFSCEQKVEPADQTGGWIKLAQSTIVLQPGASQNVSFKLDVPQTADVGEHSACVVVQDVNQTPAQTVGNGGTGILLSTRSAVRVYVTVPGEITRHLEISGFSVTRDPKRSSFFYLRPKIKNTGNVSIDTGLTVTVRNPIGMPIYTESGGYTLMRDQETEWNFEMRRPFWGGLYAAKFTAQYDPSPEATLGKDSNHAKTILRSRTIWFGSMPTPLGALAWMILLILLAFAYILYRRHQATLEWIKKSWVNHTVAAGEDMTGLGARYKIDWRIIAAANGLKPPYSLKTGEVIKVPPAASTGTAKPTVSKPKPKKKD